MRNKTDLIKDIIFFFVTLAVTFGYVMLIQLIISFVTSSYLHFKIESMLFVAGICTVLMGILYITKKIKEYRR